MKILAIRGRNLASLEGEFDIDFTAEPLRSAGIFAISGPTGAGKSTLLDAMCLALFARTPRTEQAKENNVRLRDVNDEQLSQSDPRFLLRRGTASGYAETDFMALDGRRFRARWAVSRARDKEDGRLQQARIALYDLDKGMEIAGSRSELQSRIAELIGLTFEQFTRSVLLAQNDFSTFLKADQSEKASLLEKLTGTELYSAISRLIFERNTRAREIFDAVQQQIQGIELLPDEEERALRVRLKGKEEEVRRWEQAKAERQKLHDAFHAAEQLLLVRQKQQQEAVSRLVRFSNLLQKIQFEYEHGEDDLQRVEDLFCSLRQEIQQARKLDVQLDAAVRDLKVSGQQLATAVARVRETEDKYREATARQRQGLEEMTRLAAWRERFQSKARIAEQLSALQLHLDAAFAARRDMENAEQTLAGLRRQAEQAKQQQTAVQETVRQKQTALERTEQECGTLEERLKAIDRQILEKQADQLRRERERYLIEQARMEASGNIRDLRGKLQEGQPCPVCGSRHHPYVEAAAGAVSIVSAISGLTLRLKELENQKKACEEDTNRLSRFRQQLIQLHKDLTDSENTCKEIAGRLQVLTERQAHEESVGKECALRMEQSLAAAGLLFGNDGWQQKWRQNPEAFSRTLTDFAREWHENAEKLRQLERQDSARRAECESLASFLPSLHKQQKEAERTHGEKQTAFSALQSERSKLLEGHPADSVEQDYTQRIEKQKDRLKKLLTAFNAQFSACEQARGTTGQLSKELDEVKADLAVKKDAFETWKKTFLATSPDSLPVDALLSRAAQEQTELAFRLRMQTENREKVSGLQKELDKRRTESERWAKLNDLAGSADGAKFRRIAQGYTLDILLNDANVQLRELSRRYRLERVPGTLALQVIDRDMCDEVRSVHSLSGGESFLVSLALALGLSSLSSNRMRVESLFIDEGFGSLDAETLRVAMDALESLHTQGRKIGVISHVQEMTERIAVRIQVKRAGNGRSYIEIQS